MGKIDVAFGDVPDQYQATPPGRYAFSIQEAPELGLSKANNQMLTVVHTIETEGDYQGRTVKNWLVIKNPIKIKRLALAVGMSREEIEAGFDTEELVGKSGEFILKSETYKDDDQNDREACRVSDYIVPDESDEATD